MFIEFRDSREHSIISHQKHFYGGRNCVEGKRTKTNQLDIATAARVASDNNHIVYFGGTTLTLAPLRSSDNLCTLSAIMSEAD